MLLCRGAGARGVCGWDANGCGGITARGASGVSNGACTRGASGANGAGDGAIACGRISTVDSTRTVFGGDGSIMDSRCADTATGRRAIASTGGASDGASVFASRGVTSRRAGGAKGACTVSSVISTTGVLRRDVTGACGCTASARASDWNDALGRIGSCVTGSLLAVRTADMLSVSRVTGALSTSCDSSRTAGSCVMRGPLVSNSDGMRGCTRPVGRSWRWRRLVRKSLMTPPSRDRTRAAAGSSPICRPRANHRRGRGHARHAAPAAPRRRARSRDTRGCRTSPSTHGRSSRTPSQV